MSKKKIERSESYSSRASTVSDNEPWSDNMATSMFHSVESSMDENASSVSNDLDAETVDTEFSEFAISFNDLEITEEAPFHSASATGPFFKGEPYPAGGKKPSQS